MDEQQHLAERAYLDAEREDAIAELRQSAEYNADDSLGSCAQ